MAAFFDTQTNGGDDYIDLPHNGGSLIIRKYQNENLVGVINAGAVHRKTGFGDLVAILIP